MTKERVAPCAKLMACLKRLPDGLQHWPGYPNGEDFDPMKSELAEWLCQQPEIRTYVVSRLGYLRLIVFDKASGAWSVPKNLEARFAAAQAEGKDVGKPVHQRPDKLLEILGNYQLTAKEWQKAAYRRFGTPRSTFYRHFKILQAAELIEEVGVFWTKVKTEDDSKKFDL